MEAIGSLSGVVSLIILIAAILAFLLPFFVLKIRNKAISIDRKMDVIIELLGGGTVNTDAGGILKKIGIQTYKDCPHCGTKNRSDDYTCMACSKPL